MIAWVSNYLVRVLLKNEVIETKKIEIYQYGYEIMFSTVITFVIILVSGIILNCLLAALLYFLIFGIMRQICGGYHAQNYWSCNTLFAVVTVCVLLVFKYFPMEEITAIHFIFLLFSLLVIYVYAPVENENKPISKNQKTLFRKISRIAVVTITLISCLVYMLKSPYTKLIDLTLMVVAVFTLVGGVKERRICYEENSQEEHSEDFC